MNTAASPIQIPDWLSDGLTRCVLTGEGPLPPSVVCHFDGLCEPVNPGGVATVAWAVGDGAGGTVREFHALLAHGGRRATNNWAEWAAFGTLLRYVVDSPGVRTARIFGDSLLVVSQFNGSWATRAEHLRDMCERARLLAAGFEVRGGRLKVGHVPRARNMAADSLSEKAFFAYAADADPMLAVKFHKARERRAALKAEKKKARGL